MSIGGHQSAAARTTTWLTPPWLIHELGPFDVDPCCPPDMPWTTARVMLTESEDGLFTPWPEKARIWLNPPYGTGEIEPWLEKMAVHCDFGGGGIALIFARTETSAFHRFVWPCASGLLFLAGRLNFHLPCGARSEKNAGAPSVLIAYSRSDAEILRRSRIRGAYVELQARGAGLMCDHLGRAIVCCGDWGPVLRLEDGGKVWFFEFSERFGPSLVSGRTEKTLETQPVSPRHPFWRPFELWLKQGKRTEVVSGEERPRAVWDPDRVVEVYRVAAVGRRALYSEDIARRHGIALTHEIRVMESGREVMWPIGEVDRVDEVDRMA